MTAPRTTRGTHDRGIGRERNVERGSMQTVVPDQSFNVKGFDTGKADTSKPGIREGLDDVAAQIRAQARRSEGPPLVTVTGHASDSRVAGKGAQHYARERAEAVKDGLVKRGIPPEWIQTTTSREDGRTGPTNATPEAMPPRGRRRSTSRRRRSVATS